jgi:hypothetical protein
MSITAGVLWSDYIRLSDKEDHLETKQLLSSVHNALIPSKQWRNLADDCKSHHFGDYLGKEPNHVDEKSSSNSNQHHPYMVFHARVETNIMTHKCSKYMESNLTKMFGWVDAFVEGYNEDITAKNNAKNSAIPKRQQRQPLRGIMIATSRSNMKQHDEMAVENWNVLNQRSVSYVNGTSYATEKNVADKAETSDVRNGASPLVFECGEGWVREGFYGSPKRNYQNLPKDYYGTIVPQILDFWLAVQADVFVGVLTSTWSTDVWTTRYYQGRGAGNFQYTREGITPVPNGGLPTLQRPC